MKERGEYMKLPDELLEEVSILDSDITRLFEESPAFEKSPTRGKPGSRPLLDDPDALISAAVLLASCEVGADMTLVAKQLEVPQSVIAPFVERFRSNHIWSGDQVRKKVWTEDPREQYSVCEFYLDVLVGVGDLERGINGRYYARGLKPDSHDAGDLPA
jgi:hypothetical protein